MATKMIAPRSGWPTREIELLIAEPRPENRLGREFISVLVRGATTSEIPTPKSTIAGMTSIQTPSGGTRLDGVSKDAFQPGESAGRRAYQSIATAINAGPPTRNRRAPSRPARVPTRVDRTDRRMPVGTPMAPAASAV